jgi:hypothetical protein
MDGEESSIGVEDVEGFLKNYGDAAMDFICDQINAIALREGA